jgi:hypothetical protein
VPPPHVPSSPPLLSYLGVYEPTSPASYSGVEEFTRLIGYRPRIAVYYSSWFEPFQTTFAQAAHAHGASPMVQIEPSGISLAAIAAGEYDSYLAAYARAVRSYGLFAGARAHGLLGVVWFDVKGHNLRIENDPAAIATFQRAVGTYFQPTASGHPGVNDGR